MTALESRSVTGRRAGRRGWADASCPSARASGPAVSEPTLFDDGPVSAAGEPTLEELVSGLWDGLVAHQRVPCPICAGEMAPGYGAHAQTVAGRCQDCGTTLA